MFPKQRHRDLYSYASYQITFYLDLLACQLLRGGSEEGSHQLYNQHHLHVIPQKLLHENKFQMYSPPHLFLLCSMWEVRKQLFKLVKFSKHTFICKIKSGKNCLINCYGSQHMKNTAYMNIKMEFFSYIKLKQHHMLLKGQCCL